MNFRELIDQHAAYKDITKKPRAIKTMALKCGISRPHIYNLFRGLKTAPPWTIARIAKGLGVEIEVVEKALAASLAEGVK